MVGIYLDTSAVGRVLLVEPEASVIRAILADYDGRWSSELLVVELRRLAAREGIETVAESFLAGIDLLGVDSASLQRRRGCRRMWFGRWTPFISRRPSCFVTGARSTSS